MLKWAKARIHQLTLSRVSLTDAIAAGGGDAQSSMISAAAQRVSRRLVALSSSGFDSPTAREIINALERAPTHARAASSAAPRRPGMQARWKEQNRVPFHNITT